MSLSANLGTSVIYFRATSIYLFFSFIAILIILTSSSSFLISISPFLRMFSCMFDFSYKIHNSSLRSINQIPVQFLLSQACSYFFRSERSSFSIDWMIMFNFSISLMFWSTYSFFAFRMYSCLFKLAWYLSRSWICFWRMCFIETIVESFS